MKKLAMIGIASLIGSGVYAQGTLTFWDNFGDLQFQIYSPNPSSPGTQQIGETASQGAISGVSGPYTTYNGTAIGGSFFSGTAPATIGTSSALYADGNLFTAQLYASPAGAPNNIDPSTGGNPPAFSSLLPVTQYITTFATNSASGPFMIAATPVPDAGIPGTGYDNSGLHGGNHILNDANIAVAAWYNGGGVYTTLAEAQSAGVPWGVSPVEILTGLGEPASVETADVGHTTPLTQPTEPYGIESFSLVTTPEPSTIALGVMGVGAFLARRRKK
jgi:hypothetical protein